MFGLSHQKYCESKNTTKSLDGNSEMKIRSRNKKWEVIEYEFVTFISSYL